MESQTKECNFSHIVLNGTPAQNGKQQGEVIKSIPGFKDYFGSGSKRMSARQFEDSYSLFERYAPEINQEAESACNTAGVPLQDCVFYANTFLFTGHCSHLVLLPPASSDNRILLGRSYEFSDGMDDLRLCTTKTENKFAHIGFSAHLFGRMEGRNEHGLCVTMSAGGIPVGAGLEGQVIPPIQDGFQFWVLVRLILENCKTVQEAVSLAKEIPLCCNVILILADINGEAALLEIFGSKIKAKFINRNSSENHLFATNHFTLEQMQELSKPMKNSLVRYQTIQEWVNKNQPGITNELLRSFLSKEYPRGLCCHYYQEFFGTIRSLILSPQSDDIEICFGSPNVNPWFNINQHDLNPQKTLYSGELPQEKASADFWF